MKWCVVVGGVVVKWCGVGGVVVKWSGVLFLTAVLLIVVVECELLSLSVLLLLLLNVVLVFRVVCSQ